MENLRHMIGSRNHQAHKVLAVTKAISELIWLRMIALFISLVYSDVIKDLN